jgi:hypothetical protein
MDGILRDAIWQSARRSFAKTEPDVARRLDDTEARRRFDSFLDTSASESLTLKEARRYAEVMIWSAAGRWVRRGRA